MKLFKKMKDGGAESTVTGYWLCEFKSLFSIVLLKFEGPSRNAYHQHAFNCINWLLKGRLEEWEYAPPNKRFTHRVPRLNTRFRRTLFPSWKPFQIKRTDFHKVDAPDVSWVLSFRGPWAKTWKEYLPDENRERTLTHGRIEV